MKIIYILIPNSKIFFNFEICFPRSQLELHEMKTLQNHIIIRIETTRLNYIHFDTPLKIWTILSFTPSPLSNHTRFRMKLEFESDSGAQTTNVLIPHSKIFSILKFTPPLSLSLSHYTKLHEI